MPSPTYVPLLASGTDVSFRSVTVTGATAGTTVFSAQITGDTVPQVSILGNGKIQWSSGSTAPDVNIFRDGSVRLHTTNDFVTEGSLVCDVAGGGLNIREGVNARSGLATLVAGTATVTTSKVTANSRIQLTPQNLGTVTKPQPLGVTARTAGTSFVITSADATDTSQVAWTIIEPAT